MTDSNGKNGTFAESMNVLTEQIGRLTEVVTVGFSDLKDLVREQAETSKRQEQHISRLVDTVARQADTVARQAEVVDALIRDRQNS